MLMIQKLAAVLLAVLLLPILSVAYSFIRTAGGARYSLAFDDKDRFGQPGRFVKRRYRGVFHFLFRLADTLRYLYPLLRVFLLRTIPPAFREKIMITTAVSNDCSM